MVFKLINSKKMKDDETELLVDGGFTTCIAILGRDK
jgi:hypothetical protein